MTLVISIQTNRSLWLMADRRLTVANKVLRDDATKICCLDTLDGKAIIGYAGLGATARGMEPSEWISNSLRGLRITIEQALEVLANAARKALPAHLIGVSEQFQHVMLVPAFTKSTHLYSIEYQQKGKEISIGLRRLVKTNRGTSFTPRASAVGSGSELLSRNLHWHHKVCGLVRAFNNEKISGNVVAEELNAICQSVHLALTERGDNSVGNCSIVAWRDLRSGGGNHVSFTGTKMDQYSASIPTIANGMDVSTLAKEMLPHLWDIFPQMEAHRKEGHGEMDQQHPAMKAFIQKTDEIAKELPFEPDERLR
ncbi:hypothetical protein [Rhizobium sp. AG855]|uniref:hypothetical protein n=1 Tax=Rhizobium sp. AG855 TaxID=2183898 RepID=UPI000E722759|nr:hypothetical protein [Rhizobium sp. AG855]